MSDETRLKISLSKQGKGNGREGCSHSKETKEKMRAAALGRDVSHLNWTGKTHTAESRMKISEANRKRFTSPEAHPRWITDRTKVKTYHNKKADILYKVWSKSVKCRDKWKCQLQSSDCCGKLEAHHIFNWTEYPELRYELSNGITLCHSHHPRGREKEKRFIETYKELINVSIKRK